MPQQTEDRKRYGEVAQPVKLKFHGADTDTDILADFRARILARKSACHGVQQLPRSTCPTRALFVARISDKLSCTVPVYKITR